MVLLLFSSSRHGLSLAVKQLVLQSLKSAFCVSRERVSFPFASSAHLLESTDSAAQLAFMPRLDVHCRCMICCRVFRRHGRRAAACYIHGAFSLTRLVSK